ALVCHMTGLVDGIDVASGGELLIALDAGADPHEVSFAGPAKTDGELTQAVAAGILVNVESAREIDILASVSSQLGLPARVAVRVNPDFELKGSGMKMGGGPKPFGVDAETVPDLLRAIGERNLSFEGFHVFAGSQNLKVDSIVEAQTKSYDLVRRLSERAPSPVRWLNLGGGFGVPYFPGDVPLELVPVVENLNNIADASRQDFGDARIVLELGRYLVAEAGVYVCRVIDKKVSRGHRFLITDGGLHHNLSASGNFGQVIRRNYPVHVGTGMDRPSTEVTSVVGPLCTPLDLLGDKMQLAVAEPGDLIVIRQSGAYGATASPQSFLNHPAVVEVLV
ncbi:MAG: pyridoxal-dependent decarboxylase, exosortase A system-associated, partial [Gemmatimonadota bacterium]